MPELPEVETVRRGLAARLIGREIARVEARRPDLRIPFPPDFTERLEGRRIEAIDRRAKYLLIRLDGGLVLIAHLGMSGRFLFEEPGEDAAPLPVDLYRSGLPDRPAPSDPHTHVVFAFDDGLRLLYRDPRRFGLMTLAREADLPGHPLLKSLGLEPLGPDFSGAALAKKLAGKRTPLKAALLDQGIVAGIGNIYACEALFRAGLSPQRLAATVTRREADRLAAAIRAVLEEAIEAGGSTLRDYARTDGELGYFQHRFSVYDREGAACPKPKCRGTVSRLVQSNRSTFYCPTCQR